MPQALSKATKQKKILGLVWPFKELVHDSIMVVGIVNKYSICTLIFYNVLYRNIKVCLRVGSSICFIKLLLINSS